MKTFSLLSALALGATAAAQVQPSTAPTAGSTATIPTPTAPGTFNNPPIVSAPPAVGRTFDRPFIGGPPASATTVDPSASVPRFGTPITGTPTLTPGTPAPGTGITTQPGPSAPILTNYAIGGTVRRDAPTLSTSSPFPLANTPITNRALIAPTATVEFPPGATIITNSPTVTQPAAGVATAPRIPASRPPQAVGGPGTFQSGTLPPPAGSSGTPRNPAMRSPNVVTPRPVTP